MKGTIKIFSDGTHTLLELGGKTMGPGVTRIAFEHDGKDVRLSMDINAKDFAFLPDGRFDEATITQEKSDPSLDNELPPIITAEEMVAKGQLKDGFYIM